MTINAQVLDPVKWEITTQEVGDGEYDLVFKAHIQEGWTVYSQFTDDDGPVPTEIIYEIQEGVDLIGKGEETGNEKRGFDKIFEVDVIKYLSDQPYTITQRIKLSESNGEISGYLTYMTCDEERCLPPTDVDFSFELGAKKKEDKSEKIEPKIDSPSDELPSNISVDLSNSSDESGAAKQSNGLSSINLNQSRTTADLNSPVEWEFEVEDLGEGKYNLHYTALLETGWTIYSQFTSDDGPIPTEVIYENLEGVELLGKPIEEGDRKEGLDPVFEVNVIKYTDKKPYRITQQVSLDNEGAVMGGYITFMSCNDQKCIPADKEFTFELGNVKNASTSKEEILANRLKGDKLDQRIESLVSTFETPLSDCGQTKEVSTSLIWTFIFGFIGGFFALLTPCVFPMLPITVSFFMKDNKRSGLANGLIYGASIIAIYVTLGLLITAILGPDALNRLSTNWIANSLFFLIFLAFAFSFFGFYEITLPSSWTTKSDQMADKGGLIGIFFMAFTLALVSFSCTGPIIGTALVQAASKGEYIGPFMVMLGFSSALALPFGLFAAFPSWLNSLPRSGSWMNSVKVVLGFLELALAFKFLSVADMTNHWGFLRYELFMGLWILIFGGMALYLFGFIKFPHDSPIKKLGIPRMAFGVSVLALCLYLSTGFMVREDTKSYKALPIMSGIAPPANYNYFLPPLEVDFAIKDKYPSYTKCANNIDCFKDYYDGLAYAKETNTPILLDFTGYGCVNCRKTEEHIWVVDKIRKTLNEDLVLISLYVDDDAKLDQPLISEVTGKKLRNIGNKWTDFQIVNFQQNSQPLYIVVTPDEKVITKPRGYEEGSEGYYNFLQCGLDHFRSMAISN